MTYFARLGHVFTRAYVPKDRLNLLVEALTAAVFALDDKKALLSEDDGDPETVAALGVAFKAYADELEALRDSLAEAHP